MGQRQPVARRCEARLQLQDLLELTNRLNGRAVSQMYSPSKQMGLHVRRVLLEDSVESFGALIIPGLAEGDLRETVPSWDEVRSLVGSFRQDALRLIGLPD